MCQKNAKAICTRLNRIAGQVRGVSQMVADDRYCIDILHQTQAIKAALANVETEILKSHAAWKKRSCLELRLSNAKSSMNWLKSSPRRNSESYREF